MGRKAKQQRQRRHVYFVIDDGDGHAIRKIDLSSDYDSDDDAAQHEDGTIEMTPTMPLPRALIRLPDARPSESFVASGTKILVTGCRWPESNVPAFDVRSRSLTLGPRRPHEGSPGRPLYMPVRRNLVSLLGSSTEFLDPPPPERTIFIYDWSWVKLDDAPFTRAQVTSYAAHPDGRTLFVSTVTKGGSPATFTLDTEDGVWTKRGDWKLPFRGHAQFDPALDAWVGIPRGKGARRGHLCSCDVASIIYAEQGQ